MLDRKYKSKYITVTAFTVENTITTRIEFQLDSTHNRTVWIPTPAVRIFFLYNYKHLGITDSNVDDFMKEKDVKYKIDASDIEYFLDEYFYEFIEKTEKV